jgi:DNA-binding NtrC family response regulator
MTTANSTKLFLVDADSFSIALYEQHIRNLGYKNVITLTSGNINIHQLYNYPGIILLEYRLASNNGFQLISKIKNANPGIYIVLVTGKSKIVMAEEALRYGAFDIVVTGHYFQASLSEVLGKIQFSEAVEELCDTEVFTPYRPLYVHADGSISHYMQ